MPHMDLTYSIALFNSDNYLMSSSRMRYAVTNTVVPLVERISIYEYDFSNLKKLHIDQLSDSEELDSNLSTIVSNFVDVNSFEELKFQYGTELIESQEK